MSVKNLFKIFPNVKKPGAAALNPGTYKDTLPEGYLNAILNNGVGRYVCPLIRITFKFCKEYKSSHGVREYIEKYLVDFAKENPGIAVYAMPRRHRGPYIVAEYCNIENLFVKDYTAEDIKKWVNYFKSSSGYPAVQILNDVKTENTSVQGLWNPFLNKDTSWNIENWPSEKISKVESVEETATSYVINLVKEENDNK